MVSLFRLPLSLRGSFLRWLACRIQQKQKAHNILRSGDQLTNSKVFRDPKLKKMIKILRHILEIQISFKYLKFRLDNVYKVITGTPFATISGILRAQIVSSPALSAEPKDDVEEW